MTESEDSRQYIPLHTIVEWLSRRKTFHVREFKERFYPNEDGQAPYTRLNRLKRDKYIAKSMNTHKGMWESLVNQEDLPEVKEPESIPLPVGNSSVGELPNPLAGNKSSDIESIRAMLKQELYDFGDEFIPTIMMLGDRPEIEAPQKAAKETRGSGKKCYHPDSDPEVMKSIEELEKRFKNVIEENPQFEVRDNWPASQVLNGDRVGFAKKTLWEIYRQGKGGYSSETLREISDVLYQLSDHFGRKARKAEKESETKTE